LCFLLPCTGMAKIGLERVESRSQRPARIVVLQLALPDHASEALAEHDDLLGQAHGHLPSWVRRSFNDGSQRGRLIWRPLSFPGAVRRTAVRDPRQLDEIQRDPSLKHRPIVPSVPRRHLKDRPSAIGSLTWVETALSFPLASDAGAAAGCREGANECERQSRICRLFARIERLSGERRRSSSLTCFWLQRAPCHSF
jgi:hypothetical protein